MEFSRSSGILLHITSLPGPYGIGDLGPTAYKFVDFLKESGHTVWQLLPLNPTAIKFSHSPYSSFSAFAGNPLLISPELLEQEGFADLSGVSFPNSDAADSVDFKKVENFKNDLLDEAFQKFKNTKNHKNAFKEFCKEQAFWLEDYSLYLALKLHFEEKHWTDWPEGFRDRKKEVLEEAKTTFLVQIEKEKFKQFLFYSQWEKLKKYAGKNNILLIGDIPFYINHDSADCWAHREIFKLDKENQPKKLSGVPPDYFSKTGQLWGTPVYNWRNLKKDNFDWWVARIKQNLFLFDVVRLDHFRAFSASWEVPSREETAVNGKWNKNPGIAFFRKIKKEFPEMPFIAEDLGTLDEQVYQLIETFHFPGMKVLLFAFGGDAKNPYLPFNYSSHNIVYTGTHDNTTSKAWFKGAPAKERVHLQNYAGKPVTSKNVHLVLHEIALKSVAKLAIFPVQDILGLTEEAVMNIPGTTKGNWTWRLTSEEKLFKKAKKLREMNRLFGRYETVKNDE